MYQNFATTIKNVELSSDNFAMNNKNVAILIWFNSAQLLQTKTKSFEPWRNSSVSIILVFWYQIYKTKILLRSLLKRIFIKHFGDAYSWHVTKYQLKTKGLCLIFVSRTDISQFYFRYMHQRSDFHPTDPKCYCRHVQQKHESLIR